MGIGTSTVFYLQVPPIPDPKWDGYFYPPAGDPSGTWISTRNLLLAHYIFDFTGPLAHWPPRQTFYIYPNPNHQAQPAFEPRAAATELPKSRLASAARWHPGKRPTTAAWRGHPLHNHALLVPPSLSPSPRHHPSRGHAGQPGALDQSTSRFVTQPGVLNPMSVVCWGLLSRCL
jgi:hypothetical protein